MRGQYLSICNDRCILLLEVTAQARWNDCADNAATMFDLQFDIHVYDDSVTDGKQMSVSKAKIFKTIGAV